MAQDPVLAGLRLTLRVAEVKTRICGDRVVERSTTSFSNIGLRWKQLSKTGLCGISSQLPGSFVLVASREFFVADFWCPKLVMA